MHTKHIFVVKANNAELAISKVNNEFEMCDTLTSDNWWIINGAVDLVSNAYTPNDTDRDFDVLHSIEGIVGELKKFANKETYDKVRNQLLLSMSNEHWDNVISCAKTLDGIKNAVEKNEVVLSADKITEINEYEWFEFGITDWTMVDVDPNDDKGVFAVIVDFHH